MTCIRLELKQGEWVLQSMKWGRPRATLLGLGVRKAWHKLSLEFPNIPFFELKLEPFFLEGCFGTTSQKNQPPLVEMVRRFKLLCQEEFSRLNKNPSDLWVPGFIESTMNTASPPTPHSESDPG